MWFDHDISANLFEKKEGDEECYLQTRQEFFEKIKEDNLKIVMHDYGGFEKVGELPWSISRNDEDITTKPGDLIPYQGNQITVYYAENTWSFTKLGHLNGTEDEIREAFDGKEDVIAEFSVEWTE